MVSHAKFWEFLKLRLCTGFTSNLQWMLLPCVSVKLNKILPTVFPYRSSVLPKPVLPAIFAEINSLPTGIKLCVCCLYKVKNNISNEHCSLPCFISVRTRVEDCFFLKYVKPNCLIDVTRGACPNVSFNCWRFCITTQPDKNIATRHFALNCLELIFVLVEHCIDIVVFIF